MENGAPGSVVGEVFDDVVGACVVDGCVVDGSVVVDGVAVDIVDDATVDDNADAASVTSLEGESVEVGPVTVVDDSTKGSESVGSAAPTLSGVLAPHPASSAVIATTATRCRRPLDQKTVIGFNSLSAPSPEAPHRSISAAPSPVLATGRTKNTTLTTIKTDCEDHTCP